MRYNEEREVFGVFQVDNMSSNEDHDYLYSADEVKEIPPMLQSSDITGNTRHSLPAYNTSGSWPKVHWIRWKSERNVSFKNPVFTSHHGLKPHVKYGAGFRFQNSRNLLFPHISPEFISQQPITPGSGREITFWKQRMNFHLPRKKTFLHPSDMHSGWHHPPPISRRRQCPFRLYNCFFTFCKVLSKLSRKMWME